MIVAGDFNAPPTAASQRVYDAAGLADAHAAVGSGFAHTWPVDRLPPFVPGVRIDGVRVPRATWPRSPSGSGGRRAATICRSGRT